jgi:uncharacterized membrane protein
MAHLPLCSLRGPLRRVLVVRLADLSRHCCFFSSQSSLGRLAAVMAVLCGRSRVTPVSSGLTALRLTPWCQRRAGFTFIPAVLS